MEVQTKAIDQQASEYTRQATALVIKNNSNYKIAGQFLLGLKSLRKEINSTFKPIITKAHEAHKEAVAQMKRHSQPVDEAEKIIKQKISGYIIFCEGERRKEEAQLRAIAKKKQEAEAAKIAEQLEEAGEEEEAAEVIQEAAEISPVVIAPKIEPKIAGVSSRKVWRYQLKNIKDVKADFLTIDEKKINSLVRNLGKNAESIIGGIRVYQDTIIPGRG